jgi:hypothetical protein
MAPEPPRWIWNKGLASLCDWRIPDEFPNGPEYVPVRDFAGGDVGLGPPDLIQDAERFEGIGGGALVWVRASWLGAFVARVLPRIHGEFVLLTGDSDSSLPSEAPQLATALLSSPYLVHWYTQNHDGTGPAGRVSPIPIGLDFHTRSERPRWGEAPATPAEQEAALDEIASSLPPLAERIPAIYVDFGWSTDPTVPRSGARLLQPRATIVAGLRGQPLVVSQDTRLPQTEVWRRRGRYAFCLSPHGNGLDCHRTWETLVLGSVALVPSSSLDPLFGEVRAVPFARWPELTAENLASWLEEACLLAHPAPALTSEHWITRIRLACR